MMHGEFESMKALHETMPDLAPRPIAWGTYDTAEDIHFLLCEFHDMDEDLCSLDTFPKLVADLHKKGGLANRPVRLPRCDLPGTATAGSQLVRHLGRVLLAQPRHHV